MCVAAAWLAGRMSCPARCCRRLAGHTSGCAYGCSDDARGLAAGNVLTEAKQPTLRARTWMAASPLCGGCPRGLSRFGPHVCCTTASRNHPRTPAWIATKRDTYTTDYVPRPPATPARTLGLPSRITHAPSLPHTHTEPLRLQPPPSPHSHSSPLTPCPACPWPVPPPFNQRNRATHQPRLLASGHGVQHRERDRV